MLSPSPDTGEEWGGGKTPAAILHALSNRPVFPWTGRFRFRPATVARCGYFIAIYQ